LSYAYHHVCEGESLSTIARRYKTTVPAILKANNIRNRQFIKTGRRLKISLSRGKARASTLGETYKVKKGDSLWLVAQKFNTDVETLKRINNLKSSNLVAGQTLNFK